MNHYSLDRVLQTAALESIDYDQPVYVIEGDDAGTRYYRTSILTELRLFERIVYCVTVRCV